MTWIYEPSAYATGMADSSSGFDLSGCQYEPWLVLSGTATQRPCSWRGWKNRPWISALFGTISQPSMAARGVAEWIASLPVSPANPGPVLGSRRELTTTVGFGRKSQPSLMTFDPATCSWRTSPDSIVARTEADLPSSSRILPTSGSMRNGVCSQRPTLAPPTSGSGSGSWPTPQAHGAKGTGPHDLQRNTVPLPMAAKMWQTPTTSETEGNGMRSGSRSGEPKLQGQAKMWPTPRAHDGTSGGDKPSSHPKSGGAGLQTAARSHHDHTTMLPGTDGQPKADLNPRFVAALMGVPWGWLTPSTLEATDWSRWQQVQPSWPSMSGLHGRVAPSLPGQVPDE